MLFLVYFKLGKTLSEWIFDLESVHWIKKAIQLNQQLLLDWVAISMLIDLMKEELIQQNAQLKSTLRRHRQFDLYQ
ncbi:hypothetical protein CXF81_02305 [Glaciecola sp. 33A]|nr:hypothetical protein CXF81_02305 [Glaciecola sp. 33A]